MLAVAAEQEIQKLEALADQAAAGAAAKETLIHLQIQDLHHMTELTV
jgi:hypothetical protein